MADTGAGTIVTEAGERLLCPFDLQVWAVDRMLNFEITDDSHYEGLELQVFDDPAHGRGMAILLRRRQDGRIDVYRQPGLTLDPEMARVGGELGAWAAAPIDPASLSLFVMGGLNGGSLHSRANTRDRSSASTAAWTLASRSRSPTTTSSACSGSDGGGQVTALSSWQTACSGLRAVRPLSRLSETDLAICG